MSTLTEADLEVGGLYRAKKPLTCRNGEPNDRVILWIGSGKVQYDSYAVANGRRYPSVTFEKFLAWADRRIEEEEAT